MNKRTSAYLLKKQLGGLANERGNDYEMTYACFRIIELVLHYPEHLHNIYLSSQYEGYVDDLHINQDVPGKRRELFHQLKTSARLAWGKGKGSLQYDFNEQAKVQRQKPGRFQLFLVVSNDHVYASMKRDMPTRLKKFSRVKSFPWLGSLNAQCVYHSTFRQLAGKLCAFTDVDKINAMVKCLFASWACTEKKNIPLSHLLNSARQIGSSFLRMDLPVFPRNEVLSILTAVPGFSFAVEHGYLRWRFSRTDSGQIPYSIDSPEFRNIEEEIIAAKPASFDILEQIIS